MYLAKTAYKTPHNRDYKNPEVNTNLLQTGNPTGQKQKANKSHKTHTLLPIRHPRPLRLGVPLVPKLQAPPHIPTQLRTRERLRIRLPVRPVLQLPVRRDPRLHAHLEPLAAAIVAGPARVAVGLVAVDVAPVDAEILVFTGELDGDAAAVGGLGPQVCGGAFAGGVGVGGDGGGIVGAGVEGDGYVEGCGEGEGGGSEGEEGEGGEVHGCVW